MYYENKHKRSSVTGSPNISIALINFFSLLLGGISLAFIISLSRKNSSSYLKYYSYFLVCSIIAGFFDWIVFNWVLFLIPQMQLQTAESIYHIFWDLIGFPAAFLSLIFLCLMLNQMINVSMKNNFIKLLFFLPVVITLMSYTSFYFRIQNIESSLIGYLWITYLFILPSLQLLVLVLAYYWFRRGKMPEKWIGNFLLIFIFCYTCWAMLSLLTMHIGIFRYLIIFAYYLTLFLPALYLYIYEKKEEPALAANLNIDGNINDTLTQFELKEREKEIILLLLKGKSNKEISDELFISLQTVKNYVSRIYKKLDIKNRVELVNMIRETPKSL